VDLDLDIDVNMNLNSRPRRRPQPDPWTRTISELASVYFGLRRTDRDTPVDRIEAGFEDKVEVDGGVQVQVQVEVKVNALTA